MSEVRVPAFAKLNLDLRVLYRRNDGYHELRSIFQTISLADRIRIRYRPARRTDIRLAGNVDIPDNLMIRAARLCLDEMKVAAVVEFELDKRIPMGAGLGGGSSDAAAVLRTLPELARRPIPRERLLPLAAQLGSDVPFFLLGGTAVVMGRGEELYPLPDLRHSHVLIVSPDIHVSTSEAYQALSSRLTPQSAERKLREFQSDTWNLGLESARNDFETVVFERHPRLRSIRNQLQRAGATTARMTGSGSSVFGLFPGRIEAESAARLFPRDKVSRVRFVTRRRYHGAAELIERSR